MGKLRRRELIPEDTPITAIIKDPKIVHGNWGRQVQTDVLVTKGEHKGTQFRQWFPFGKDESDGEEFIPYGGPLYQAFAMVEPNLDEILDDENLTEKKYQQFVKSAVKKLDGFEITARAGIRAPKDSDGNPKKDKNGNPKRNQNLQPGSFGPHMDSEEDFDELPMEDRSTV
jgi:hypothetical protein